MMTSTWRYAAVAIVLAGSVLTGCDSSDDTVIEVPENPFQVPETYEFTRNGESTVSYSGQTDRLNQLSELKTYLKKGDAGDVIEESVLLAMFANTGDNGGGNFSFTSDRQLKSKTFELDQAQYETWMVNAAQASIAGNAGTAASSGTAGLLTRANGKTVLVDENGQEFTQLIEKGLMGACFMNQMLNVYLTDDRVGPSVNNTDLEDGKNYTAMEHHWDEGFGYMGVPVDFESNFDEARGDEAIFWGNYANGRDGLLGINDALMDAFITGRAGIEIDNRTVIDAQREILYTELQRVAAATGIHYINSTLAATTDGDRSHYLSEAVAFIGALKYCDITKRVLTTAELDEILGTDIGDDFWNVSTSGLNNAKNTLASKFDLDAVKDDL